MTTQASTDLLSLAGDIAKAIHGRSARIEMRESTLRSQPDTRFALHILKGRETELAISAPTPDESVRRVCAWMLRDIEATHERAEELLARAREAGVVEPKGCPAPCPTCGHAKEEAA